LTEPLQVWGLTLLQVWFVPLHTSTFLFVQLPKLQTPGLAPAHVPATPLRQPKPPQVAWTRPLHAAPVGLPLQLPGSLSQVCFWPLQTWFWRLPQV
jgi:hypothetical protein